MAREATISEALKALETRECPSIAAAARQFDIPYNTLYVRYRKNTTRQYDAHTSQMALNKT